VGAPVRPNMFEHWLIRPWVSSPPARGLGGDCAPPQKFFNFGL